jgi:hypothetical protein
MDTYMEVPLLDTLGFGVTKVISDGVTVVATDPNQLRRVWTTKRYMSACGGKSRANECDLGSPDQATLDGIRAFTSGPQRKMLELKLFNSNERGSIEQW